jgi:Tfp pilus assembly protein PilF
VGNAFISYVRYLAKIFWPARLSPLYPHPGYWPWWEVAGAVVVAGGDHPGSSARAPQPYLAVGWFWFVIMLAPTIGLVQVGIQSMADRYSYVPSVGVLIMLAWGGNEWIKTQRWILGPPPRWRWERALVLTPRQVAYWRTSETLFLHAVEVTDNNYLAYNNLGFDLSNRGKWSEPCPISKSRWRSIPITTRRTTIWVSRWRPGPLPGGDQRIHQSLEPESAPDRGPQQPGHRPGRSRLSDAGIHEFQVALEENPRHAGAHNNYGVALAMRGQLDEAIAQFRLALACQENYLSAHSDLGQRPGHERRPGRSDSGIRICLKIDPKDPQVHNNLGNALAQQGKLAEAAAQYKMALNLRPENPEAHFNLGYCLAKQGRRAEAEEQYVLALQQRPDYPEARQQLEALKKTP